MSDLDTKLWEILNSDNTATISELIVQIKQVTGDQFYQNFLKEYLKLSPKGYHMGHNAKLAAKRAGGLE